MQKVKLSDWENQIRTAKGDGIRSFLQIGQALHEIKEGSLWRQTPAKDFSQYAAKVWGFKQSHAYSLIGVWKEWGDMLPELPELTPDVTRLIRLLPFVKPENKEELLHAASEIPDVQAFEDTVRELKGLETSDSEHDHVFEQVPYKVCSICGLKVRV